ncbi:MAG: bifunctional folylpolyglutamate synthase/dihydrofolate synthase [Candidatus Omnitrophica bacterium]|nr:bifunctional folylpolyglutamate synthase/dihydrofolate synthase [Candidatus Omnitrophota bacterium]
MTAFNPHEYLNSFANFESQLHTLRPEDFHLQRIQQFLDQAGVQTKDLKIIHVAGTKGKGSTCVFLARILQEAGCKAGLYTSPHLHRVNERIRILSRDNLKDKDPFCGAISDDELKDVLGFLRPYAAAIRNAGHILTYFEVLTVAALCYFVKAGVDVAVLETGLGGRLDATNAAESLIGVITPVSLDHTHILGDTLGKIAAEKAGIIKNTFQRVVVAPQEKEAMDVILRRCREFGVQPVLVDPNKYKDLKVGLKGGHQLLNAATAIETASLLKGMGFRISEAAIASGLKNIQWPGRFELLRQSPDVIVDGAHNEASARVLAETLKQEHPEGRVLMVLGISQDKDIGAISRALAGAGEHFILTKANHPRAYAFKEEECRKYFGGKTFEIIDHLPKAVSRALAIAQPQDVIVVAGSLFAAAEARAEITHVPV